MPELPEVETIRSGLQHLTQHKVKEIFRSKFKLRIASTLDLSDLINQEIISINRRARYLIINFTNNKSLIIHLGMSGKITCSHDFQHLKHDHFACKFDILKPLQTQTNLLQYIGDPRKVGRTLPSVKETKNIPKSKGLRYNSWLIYNDPRRFGFVDLIKTSEIKNHKMLSKLGCEPLDDDFNANYLQEELRNKKMNIKTTMMDNAIVVGVGNIYINESLFASQISPLRNACDLSKSEVTKLVNNIKKILQNAIDLKGSSISDYTDALGNYGNFQSTFKTYGRSGEKCFNYKNCKSIIQQIRQNGRSTFYCPTCQK